MRDGEVNMLRVESGQHIALEELKESSLTSRTDEIMLAIVRSIPTLDGTPPRVWDVVIANGFPLSMRSSAFVA
jgi:hypothetical protein